MNSKDQAAIDACNEAGWVAMGVGDELFVYGPPDAILRAQELLLSKRRENTPRSWEEIAIHDMGLQILRPSPHQIQFRQEGKVLADWWPGKGTTMADGQRGPVCRTGDEVILWLKNM